MEPYCIVRNVDSRIQERRAQKRRIVGKSFQKSVNTFRADLRIGQLTCIGSVRGCPKPEEVIQALIMIQRKESCSLNMQVFTPIARLLTQSQCSVAEKGIKEPITSALERNSEPRTRKNRGQFLAGKGLV